MSENAVEPEEEPTKYTSEPMTAIDELQDPDEDLEDDDDVLPA